MAEYQCESCNFRFEGQRQPLRCPFCGKANTVKPTLSAEQVMDEVLAQDKEREEVKKSLKEAR